MLRSLTTCRPASSAGRTTSSMCWARSAAMSRASALSVSSLWSGSATIERIRRPMGVPPCSRVSTASARRTGGGRGWTCRCPPCPRRRCTGRAHGGSTLEPEGPRNGERQALPLPEADARLAAFFLGLAAFFFGALVVPFGHLLPPDGEELVGPPGSSPPGGHRGPRGVGLTVGDVDTEPTVLRDDRPLADGIGAQLPQRRLGPAPPRPRYCFGWASRASASSSPISSNCSSLASERVSLPLLT